MADELQTKRIIDLAQKTAPEAGDNLAVDNATSGTRRILWENFLDNSLSDDTKAAPAGVAGQAIEDAKTTFTDTGDGNIAVNYDEDVPAGTETPLKSIRFPLLPYKYTVPVIDPTLTQPGQAADAAVVGEELTNLKEDLSQITELISPVNLLNFSDSDFEEGKYINTTGSLSSNDSYNTTGFIPVEAGKTYKYSYGGVAGNAQPMRLLCAFDASKTAVSASGSSSEISSYTVPNGIAYIRFSANSSYLKATTQNIMFSVSDVTNYYPYFDPYYRITEKASNSSVVDEAIDAATMDLETAYNTSFVKKWDTISANSQVYVVRRFDNKKNSVIEFIGYFETFTELRIGHGINIGYGNYLIIDGTNITSYGGTPPAQGSQSAHGLTFTDFIHVTITQNDKAKAKIRVMTAGGDYTMDNVSWYGCNGDVFVQPSKAMTDCILVATFQDFNKKIFVFGDSYVTVYDAARWPYYLIDNNQDNIMLAGYGGAGSSDELTAFNAIIAVTNPKFVVWTLGQNNVDSGAVNATWLSAVESVIETCEAKGIIPILATVPNCPDRDHTYKNAWVKASGYRYVDFAKAVRAEAADSTWYTGMLSSDNVHPSILGAKALYSRFIIDVPEVLNKKV